MRGAPPVDARLGMSQDPVAVGLQPVVEPAELGDVLQARLARWAVLDVGPRDGRRRRRGTAGCRTGTPRTGCGRWPARSSPSATHSGRPAPRVVASRTGRTRICWRIWSGSNGWVNQSRTSPAPPDPIPSTRTTPCRAASAASDRCTCRTVTGSSRRASNRSSASSRDVSRARSACSSTLRRSSPAAAAARRPATAVSAWSSGSAASSSASSSGRSSRLGHAPGSAGRRCRGPSRCPRAGTAPRSPSSPGVSTAGSASLQGRLGQQRERPGGVAQHPQRLGPQHLQRPVVTALGEDHRDPVQHRDQVRHVAGMRAGDQGPQPVLVDLPRVHEPRQRLGPRPLLAASGSASMILASTRSRNRLVGSVVT